MAKREGAATCRYANVRVTCSGAPTRISMCHCLACQRRTRAPFGVQAWFRSDQLRITGMSPAYIRTVEAGGHVTIEFCSHYGSTAYWKLSASPGHITIALGMFADPDVPAPRESV